MHILWRYVRRWYYVKIKLETDYVSRLEIFRKIKINTIIHPTTTTTACSRGAAVAPTEISKVEIIIDLYRFHPDFVNRFLTTSTRTSSRFCNRALCSRLYFIPTPPLSVICQIYRVTRETHCDIYRRVITYILCVLHQSRVLIAVDRNVVQKYPRTSRLQWCQSGLLYRIRTVPVKLYCSQ